VTDPVIDPPPSAEPPTPAPPILPPEPPASSDPTVPEPPVTAPEPVESPRYESKPTFNIVRVRLFPIYKRDTPTQDPFVPNFAEKKLTLTNDQGLQLINIATKKVIATGKKVKFDIALNAILVDDKKVSVLIKSEVVPNVHGSGTTMFGLKEAAHKTDGYFKFDGSFTFMKTTVTNQAGSAVSTWHLVNFVYLEDYITSVTPSEVPQKWSDPAENATEAVKAQAVAARSYGLNTIITSRKATTREWDVVPTTANQFYSGIRFLNETSKALVRATAGQILVHNNEVILAVFSANSGGYTCSSKDCWGLNLPYLQAVEDASEVRDLPGGSRQYELSRVQFQRVLKANKIIINVNSKAESISILKVNDSKRVTQITVKVAGKTFNLNAAQTNNVLTQSYGSRRLVEFGDLKNDKFTFRTFGFGHAIGMSQWGAYAFARKGLTYEQILKLYYQNTQLISLADK
ncbi:MAG: SpoIID/LytB domain-containing protein, partial [Bdellovibrionaceae bacterium]|nr:SpoIID/LytB domain-containing protein [Pseudobdellovibrionaceae bacterium]